MMGWNLPPIRLIHPLWGWFTLREADSPPCEAYFSLSICHLSVCLSLHRSVLRGEPPIWCSGDHFRWNNVSIYLSKGYIYSVGKNTQKRNDSTWLPTKSWKRLKRSLNEMKSLQLRFPLLNFRSQSRDRSLCYVLIQNAHHKVLNLNLKLRWVQVYTRHLVNLLRIFSVFFCQGVQWVIELNAPNYTSATCQFYRWEFESYIYLAAWYRLHYLHDSR